MTTRHDLVRDMEDLETILLALDGLREDIPPGQDGYTGHG